MSLLSDAMEKCTMLDKTTVSDGMGGFISQYVPGASFDAAITFDNSIAARVAAAQDVTSLYTVTTSRATTLEFHDVFQRDSDKQIFRVTSNGKDNETPASATLDMRQVSAEAWSLPT